MDTITFLGTGAGDGGSSHNKSSILLRNETAAILFDAGEPCTKTLFSLGLGNECLDSIFISHGHADHVAGLPALIHEKQVTGRKKPLSIHLPKFLVAPLKTWMAALGLPEKELGFPLHFHPLESEKKFQYGNLSVSAFPTTHDCKGEKESFGFVVSGRRRLIYSSDLGGIEDLRPLLETPTDVLICELAHISPDDIIGLLKNKKLPLLLLTHIGEPYLDDQQALAVSLDENLPDTSQVFLPMDGESYSG